VTARRAAIVLAVALAAMTGMICVRPQRFIVDGLSMAPGLMPGDVVATGWLPGADRLRSPRRFERWVVVAPDEGAAVKRVAGLPGERVTIRNGDFVVDDETVLKPPGVLAEMAVPLTAPLEADGRHARLPDDEVLDDAPFATEVNRPLEAVCDAGLVALVQTGTAAARVRVVLGAATLTWRLPARARIGMLAGHLDGHDIAVAWVDRGAADSTGLRSGLPARVPESWSFAEPRHGEGDAATIPRCELEVDDTTRIERVAAWRDVHYRAASDAVISWRLEAPAFLVLGDFPTGSIDSRQWGPLPRASFRHRLAAP
jgi:hypothetical protein